MKTRHRNTFTTIRTEGAILPPDLLLRISEGDPSLEGLQPADYHLLPNERLNEAINRSWNRLIGAWESFRAARENVLEGEPGTTVTRERWLLPLFQELGYGRLQITTAFTIEGKSYPISHVWEKAPIHLLGFNIALDKRTPGVAGAARTSPHSMLQEFLNRSDDHLWAFLSNGIQLRILRDNVSLTRQAYVEFDLASMMEGEVYADFVLLWLLCHQSRVEGDKPEAFWLEKWSRAAQEQGARALDQLRDGVEDAISQLGTGFLSHPANHTLRDKLRSGSLNTQDYYRQLLRMVYRLIFLFVAEDRSLLFAPDSDPEARQRYTLYYSTQRLRRLAERSRGSRHADLYHVLRLVTEKLSSVGGCPELALPPLGGFLFSQQATPDLDCAELPNQYLLDAVRALAYTVDGRTLRPVDYKNLGPEELGSVYESLLELHPEMNVDAGTFALTTAGGHERKTTGSYYTPSSLIRVLLDSALDPVIEQALENASRQAAKIAKEKNIKNSASLASLREPNKEKNLADSASLREEKSSRQAAKIAKEKNKKENLASLAPLREPNKEKNFADLASLREKALLNLKVCDPASGSGHFLIAAAHRIAKRLAAVRTGDDEPSPEATRTALRDVITHCIYGVDINPMAVELCKVSLWMESLEPGKPLSFLDHHIKCGNSLVGVGPGMDISEIPDDAFKPAFGDDRATATALRRRNKREREGQLGFRWDVTMIKSREDLARWVASQSQQLETMPEDEVAQIQAKANAYQSLITNSQYQRQRLEYDLWTAAFFWPIPEGDAESMLAPTQQELIKLRRGEELDAELVRRVREIAEQQRFFHWEFEFPTVFNISRKDAKIAKGNNIGSRQDAKSAKEENANNFADSTRSGDHVTGFDVVLSNPPWEKVKLMEVEFFASRDPYIAKLNTKNERIQVIKTLKNSKDPLYFEWLYNKGLLKIENNFYKKSRRYSYGNAGEVNTYALFVELGEGICRDFGYAGLIIKSSIATAPTYGKFFKHVFNNSLISFYDFKNWAQYFKGVGYHERYALMTLSRRRDKKTIVRFGFQLVYVEEIKTGDKCCTLTTDELFLFSPNTNTIPVFVGNIQKSIAKKVYTENNVLVNERLKKNTWGVNYVTLFHMSSDSHLFRKTFEFGSAGNIHNFRIVKNNKTYLYLYEGKYIQRFDHRFASYENIPKEKRYTRKAGTTNPSVYQKNNPYYEIEPRYLIAEEKYDEMREKKALHRHYHIAARLVTNVISNARSVIACLLPSVPTNNLITLLPLQAESNNEYAVKCLLFLSLLCSIPFDFIARLKISENLLKSTLWEIAAPSPDRFRQEFLGKDFLSFVLPRSLELNYVTWSLEPVALDLGIPIPPFKYDPLRRHVIQSELDAMYFHLYGFSRDEVDYVLNTFPIVEKQENKKYGEYRTKRLVLEAWERMDESIYNGIEYVPMLDPPPADPRVAHPNRDGSVYEGPGLVIDEQLSVNSDQSSERDTSSEIKEPPAGYTEAPPEEQSSSSSDYTLYKCQSCGQMVLGFDQQQHIREVHAGQPVEFIKL